MSMLDHKLEPEVTEVRRLEVITGTGRRRKFAAAFKARVVEETLAPDAVVSEALASMGLCRSKCLPGADKRRRVPAGQQAAAVCTGCCGNGVTITAGKCAARQADAPCAAELCEHRG